MAYDKVVDSAQLNAAMTATANAIREKAGNSNACPWDASTGFASLIAAIQAGGGGGGGNSGSFNGKPILCGTFTPASDITTNSNERFAEDVGFEANKAYFVFMCATGTYTNLYDHIGKKGMVGSVSRRYNTTNNNSYEAALAFDSYGGNAAGKYGLRKPYAGTHLTISASTSYVLKAGVEYGWIAVEEGV